MADGERRNDFSKGSIPSNILKLAVPMTVAQLINILYNMVDRMYIGRMPDIGRLALTGIGICTPVISIITAFSNLCGMGGSPLCSMARGAGDNDRAEKVMGNAFAMLLALGVLLTAAILIFKAPLLRLFGASDATFPYADEYMSVYACGTLFVMIGIGMNPFINAQGFGRMGMMTVALGAVINIALDPLFIFAFKMGVAGAALATVISQFCSAVWVFVFLRSRRAILNIKLSAMRLDARLCGRIAALGTSGFVMSVTNGLVQTVYNTTLRDLGGDIYVSVMTIINSLRELLFAGVNGITNGATPVLSFNYGAGEYGRARKCIVFSSLSAFCISIVVWIAMMLFPSVFIRIFNSDPELISDGVPALRMFFSMSFLFFLQISGQTVFVSLGRARTAVFFSMLRKVILVTPLIVLLPKMFGLGVKGVFLAEPISVIIGGLACYLTMIFTVYIPLGRMEKKRERL